MTSTSIHGCRVAWTIYEHHGPHSEHNVLGIPGGLEVLIGHDFPSRHKLKVGLHFDGLIGPAPGAAVPLTGGGYVLNPPLGFVGERNSERVKAAQVGEVLRPHPARGFEVPELIMSRID